MDVHAFLMNPFVHGALVGLGPAIGLDLVIFKSANSWSDFASKFQLGIASWRWLQGAFFGALAGGGLGYLVGL